MTFTPEYNPSKGWAFHGPYTSILDPRSGPEAKALVEQYFDEGLREYATNDEELLILLESRWQAQCHGDAIDTTMEDAHKQGRLASKLGDIVISNALEYWYFWPLEPEAQITATRTVNQTMDYYRQRL